MLNGDDMGEVNIFGLDEYGMPAGVSPLWGLGLGLALGQGVPAALRMATTDPTSKLLKYDEAIGAGAAVVAGGVMMAFKGTRHAGLTGIIAGLGSAGLRALEKLIMSDNEKQVQAVAMIASMKDKTKAKIAVAALAGIDISQVPLSALSGMEVQQVPSLQGAGVPQLLGAGTQNGGSSLPPQLLGASMAALQGAGAQQMAMAGLQLNGIGRHYGYSPAYGNG